MTDSAWLVDEHGEPIIADHFGAPLHFVHNRCRNGQSICYFGVYAYLKSSTQSYDNRHLAEVKCDMCGQIIRTQFFKGNALENHFI